MSTQLPREILEKALKLRNSLRGIYLALYTKGASATSVEIAGLVDKARPYVNMRLQELVDMGLAKVTRKGKRKYFEVVQNETHVSG